MTPTTGKTPLLALFDPMSLHNRFRSSVRAEDKMRGFFYSLYLQQKRAEQNLLRVHRAEQEQEDTRAAETPLALAANKARERRLVLRADYPEVPIAAKISLPPGGALDGLRMITLSLQLQDSADFPPTPISCRAYFLEPAVVTRLMACLAARPGSLRDVFRDELVAKSFEVARVLAAVPELEGIIDEKGAGQFQKLALAESCSSVPLPEDVTIVVVLDVPLPEWRKAREEQGRAAADPRFS